jgi:glycosyltransferase involved in cell wall biosynthesis
MRVLIFMFHSFPGATPGANHMRRLSMGFRANGHDVLIVAPRLPGEDLPLRGQDACAVSYVSFPMPAKPRFLPFYPHWVFALRPRLRQAAAGILKDSHWDAAIVEGTSWWAFDPLRRLCQSHGLQVAPYAIEWFNLTFRRLLGLSWIDQWLQRHVTFPKCDGLIGISRLWADVAARQKLPCIVVPSFSKFPRGELPAIAPSRGGRFRLVFSGTWLKRELPQTIFKAVEIANARGVDIELVVLGQIGHRHEEKTAMQALARSSVKDRVRMMGWVSDQVLQNEMSTADAFVLLRPDDRETRALFPTRLPEYLATGKPVIVSNAGDLALYLEHRRSAWIIPPGDRPEALADAITYLAAHAQEAREIGLCGREALEQHFSQEELAQRIVDFFSAHDEKGVVVEHQTAGQLSEAATAGDAGKKSGPC